MRLTKANLADLTRKERIFGQKRYVLDNALGYLTSLLYAKQLKDIRVVATLPIIT